MKKLIPLILIGLLILTGCGETATELTEEEKQAKQQEIADFLDMNNKVNDLISANQTALETVIKSIDTDRDSNLALLDEVLSGSDSALNVLNEYSSKAEYSDPKDLITSLTNRVENQENEAEALRNFIQTGDNSYLDTAQKDVDEATQLIEDQKTAARLYFEQSDNLPEDYITLDEETN